MSPVRRSICGICGRPLLHALHQNFAQGTTLRFEAARFLWR